jgi:hypothetical protein
MDMWESVLGCQGNSKRVRIASLPAGLACTESALLFDGQARSSSVGECGVYPPSTRRARGRAAAKTLILVSTFMDSVWHPGSVMTAASRYSCLRHVRRGDEVYGPGAKADPAGVWRGLALGTRRHPRKRLSGAVRLSTAFIRTEDLPRKPRHRERIAAFVRRGNGVDAVKPGDRTAREPKSPARLPPS